MQLCKTCQLHKKEGCLVSWLISTFAGSQDNWSTFAKVSERKFENHACPLFLFEVTKQKCSRYSHRVGLIRPRDADKEWHDTYCIFRKQNVFFNPSLLIMDRWDDSWESTNFHNFWQNLLDATQLSARCFIAKVRLSWNNLCNTAWRSSRESHESRLISLLDRRPSPTSKVCNRITPLWFWPWSGERDVMSGGALFPAARLQEGGCK